MNKKVLLACLLAFILLIIGVIIGLYVRKKKQSQVFIESDYPFTYEVLKDNTLKITLDGSKTKQLTWTYEIEDEEYISVTPKGKEHGGKATFIVAPKASGLTNIKFKRSTDLAGYAYDAAVINAPIYVTETNGGLAISFLENPWLAVGPEPVAEDTDYPFLISYNEVGSPELLYIKGKNDWTVADPNNIVTTMISSGADGVDSEIIYKLVETKTVQASVTDADLEGYSIDSNGELQIDEGAFPMGSIGTTQEVYDPTAGMILDTTITVQSQTLNRTEYLDVHIDVNGNITVTKGEAPKN